MEGNTERMRCSLTFSFFVILLFTTNVEHGSASGISSSTVDEHYATKKYYSIFQSQKDRFMTIVFGSTKNAALNSCLANGDEETSSFIGENDETKNSEQTPTRYLCGGRLSKMPSWFKSRQESLIPIVHVVNASLFFSSSTKNANNNQPQQADNDTTTATSDVNATDNSNEATASNSNDAIIERTQAKDEDNWCMLVNFFAPRCPFSAKLAPNYNALARSFPELFVAAIDATQNAKLNLIFGISGTPTIVLFQNGRPVSRYDQQGYDHQNLVDFVVKQTDLSPRPEILLLDEDALGPLSELMKDSTPDYYLMVSWYFIAICGVYYFFTSSLAEKLLENLRRNWREMDEE